MKSTETIAQEIQKDPKRMVKIWENSLRAAQKKIDAEPSASKKKEMYGQLEFAKARLAYYRAML